MPALRRYKPSVAPVDITGMTGTPGHICVVIRSIAPMTSGFSGDGLLGVASRDGRDRDFRIVQNPHQRRAHFGRRLAREGCGNSQWRAPSAAGRSPRDRLPDASPRMSFATSHCHKAISKAAPPRHDPEESFATALMSAAVWSGESAAMRL